MQLRCRKKRASNAVVFASISLANLLALTAVSIILAPGALAQPGDDTISGGAHEGMSDRIKKYMGEDGGGTPGALPPERMQRLREKLNQMPPEKREKIIQQMRERRGKGNRFLGGQEGRPPGQPGGPEGFPSGPPPEGGFPGGPPPDGIGPPDGFQPPRGFGDGPPPEGGMRRGLRQKLRNGAGAGGAAAMKGGGKLFGRAPLDLTVLKLTEDQKAKIQSMRSVNGQKARQLHSDLRTRRERFKEMLFDPQASNEQILSTRKEINKLQTQSEDLMLSDFLGIRKLLTKEQLELLPQVRPDESQRRPIAKPARGKSRGDSADS